MRRVTVVELGGGYKKAILGQLMDSRGRWHDECVFGADDSELMARVRDQLPCFERDKRAPARRARSESGE